jgi:hypothetical protein
MESYYYDVGGKTVYKVASYCEGSKEITNMILDRHELMVSVTNGGFLDFNVIYIFILFYTFAHLKRRF